ncbi:PREDICTED: BPI fold-containing family A member 2 [Miniopterus natalensis]|uniref:BPI fold-containing family A member 2 n=1 Tax=Miniopterus natalensis TaxID=291302 RepID=UPI0007A6D187|nr:PREDICTED: BPI fold-containing family A member 2 [Miniopterus natalensis]
MSRCQDKMLQLWKLVLLCGLLTGTSASVVKSVRDGLSNAVKKMEPVFGDIENSIQEQAFQPLIGKTVNLAASLGFIADIGLEPDANTGIPEVVVKNCSSNEDSISLNLLGRHSAVVNSLTDTLTGLLSKTVSLLVQNQVCPLIRLTAGTLDGNFVQAIIDKLKLGGEAQKSV